MNRRSMRIARVMGGLLFCASGAMPIQIAQAMSDEEAVTDIRQHCAREIDDHVNVIVERDSRDPVTRYRDFVTANIYLAINSDKKDVEEAVSANRYRYAPVLLACFFKRRLSQLSNASTTASAAPATPPRPTSVNPERAQRTASPRDYVPAPWPQRRAQNPLEDDAVALSSAVAYAQKRQSEVDRAREGKPKLHKSGAVAHNCLKPQPGGWVVNVCPYAVEYHYCVYHPTKDSWSASFDCEKTGGGSWQIGPGPNSRSILHTAGEMTYWFACRYGETLSKPDGISPVDIEFQRGRGLLGRCGEWGSSRG